jgi:hypothetical protein
MRKRSKYRPAAVRQNPFTQVMGNIRPFTEEEATKLSLPIHAAFSGLLDGTATEPDFDTIAAISGVCLVLGEQIDHDVVNLVKAAQDGLVRCRERKKQFGKYGLDGTARQDLAAVVDLHDQLLKLCTPLQLANAMRTVIARIDAGNVL